MRHYVSLVLLLFCVSGFAQEICNNAIDDDGDSLIDLNDPDCTCLQSVEVQSLIPNPSFEEYDYCPDSYSQLDAATDWIQATGATTDYMNTCGFASDMEMEPFPDGNAIVGTIFMNGWQEYLGTCLLSPMLGGENYQLQFHIASKPENGQLGIGNNGEIYYGPIDITLYGTANCANLPVATWGCPTESDPSWFVLGSATYTPVNEWGILTINFTPPIDVGAIMLGSPCDLPNDYVPLFENNEFADPYFFYDNLLLNETGFFNGVTIESDGDFCVDDVALHAQLNSPENGPYTYQWYKNGIAIIGATNPDYAVTEYEADASYVVVASNTDGCYKSNAISFDNAIPDMPVAPNPNDYCQFDPAVQLIAIGSNLLWYTAETGGVGSPIAPTPSTTEAGVFYFYVSQTCGAESPRQMVTVVVSPLVQSNFPPFDPVCSGNALPILPTVAPNGIVGNWLPETVNPDESGTYVFTPLDAGSCSEGQTLDITIVPPQEFMVTSGCENNVYIIRVVPTGNFSDPVFYQWYDANGNAIGTADSSELNLSAIINDSPEIEDFPITYSVTVTDGYNCEYTQTHTVESAFCTIPKGVSVNNDGDNDFFNLNGLNVKHLDIYNRYGMVVYSKENYVSEWNGQSDSGKELPDGTYYYLLTFEDEAPKTGWVYLIRKQ